MPSESRRGSLDEFGWDGPREVWLSPRGPKSGERKALKLGSNFVLAVLLINGIYDQYVTKAVIEKTKDASSQIAIAGFKPAWNCFVL
jgi:hypothetical protein